MFYYVKVANVVQKEEEELVEARKALNTNAVSCKPSVIYIKIMRAHFGKQELGHRTPALDCQHRLTERRLRRIEYRHLQSRLTKVRLEAELLNSEVPLAYMCLKAAGGEDSDSDEVSTTGTSTSSMSSASS
jgi:hypothetical protein